MAEAGTSWCQEEAIGRGAWPTPPAASRLGMLRPDLCGGNRCRAMTGCVLRHAAEVREAGLWSLEKAWRADQNGIGFQQHGP